MKTQFKKIALIILVACISSCSDDDDDIVTPAETQVTKSVTTTDFSITIDENPLNGSSLGFIQASGTGGTLVYNLIVGSGLSLDSSSGELIIVDSSFFDFELNATITGFAIVSIDGRADNEQRADIEITLNDVNEAPAKNIQQRLSTTETPFDIYQSDNSLLDSLYGKIYDGGLIFYLNTSDGTGLVAAENDQSTGMAWDTTTNFINQTATGATSKALGDGASNTSTIVTALSSLGMYAALTCSDLNENARADWFLPTADEMDEMYNNLHNKGMGNFATGRYWSSTEFDLSPKGAATWRNFDTSSIQSGGSSPKVALYYVRAARAF